jgi:hypothetical protein
MEQRPLRLGDIVDDYCPRERRITNHAIVAIVEDAIRQTRCSTCDAEHVYKKGKEPLRRRKDGAAAGVAPVPSPAGPPPAGPPSDGLPVPVATPVLPAASTPASTEPLPAAAMMPAAAHDSTNGTRSGPMDADSSAASRQTPGGDLEATAIAAPGHEDLWPAHRRLIRASLPRTDGEPPAPRPIPEFTMHQRPQGRGGQNFRHGFVRRAHGGGEPNGNVSGRDVNGRGGHGAPGDRNGNHPGGGGGRSGRRRGKRSR